MAANMGMAGNGHILMQPQQQQRQHPQQQDRQLGQFVYQNLINTPLTQPWQQSLSIQDRLGKTMQLVTNIYLAGHGNQAAAAHLGVQFEAQALQRSPDRQTYERNMATKTEEFLKKRQARVPQAQNQLSVEAARQHQLRQQQQQQQQQQQVQQAMMMNQISPATLQAQMAARAMGQGGQQGFQHLRAPMQASPIPPQPQPLGMTNPGLQPHQLPNQPPFQLNMPQQRQPGNPLSDGTTVTQQDRARAQQAGSQMYQRMTDEQKMQIRSTMQRVIPQPQLLEMAQQNKDPALFYCQQQAMKNLMQAKQQAIRQQQQQQGTAPNPNVPPPPGSLQFQQQLQQHQQLQQKQHLAMNGGTMNGLGGQGGGGVPNGQMFNNISENVLNEQKAGFLAEQAGQMVVPVSNGPGRGTATPQPTVTMAGQNTPNKGQLGGPQQPRPGTVRPPMGQSINLSQVKMEQAAAQAAAQSKAQATARQIQGQPGGGLGAPPAASQSPAMNTLGTPINQASVAGNGVDGGPGNGVRNNLGTPAMGPMPDQRFSQGVNARPISMPVLGTIPPNVYKTFMNSLNPTQLQQVNSMPQDKVRETILRWQAAQPSMNMPGQVGNQTPHMVGQSQMGQMHMNNNQFAGVGLGLPQQQPQAGLGVNPAMLQQAGLAARAQMPGNLRTNQAAISFMNNMPIPEQVRQFLQGQLPLEVQRWGDLSEKWLPHQTLPPLVRQQLDEFRTQQFKEFLQNRQAQAQAQAQQQAVASGQLPLGMPQQQQRPQFDNAIQPQAGQQPMGNSLGNMGNISFPPNVFQVTPQDLQLFRHQQPQFANADNETISKHIISFKKRNWIQRARNLHSGQQRQPQQAGLPGNSGLPTGQNSNANANTPAPQPDIHMQDSTPAPAPASAPAPAPAPAPTQSQAQKAAVVSAEPAAQGHKTANHGLNNAANRSAPSNNMPANVARNLKRPLSEMAVNPQEGPGAMGANPHRPVAEATSRARPQLARATPEQLAKMTPEQRQQYQQLVARHAHQILQTIQQAVIQQLSTTTRPDIPMSPEERTVMGAAVNDILAKFEKTKMMFLNMLAQTFPGAGTQEVRARIRDYFVHWVRLTQQFSDLRSRTLKPVLSLSKAELEAAKEFLRNLIRDWARLSGASQGGGVPGGTSAAGQSQMPGDTSQVTPGATPIPAPLNQANLEKNTQALNKLHQRSNSKSGQPPAAPTTAQPPFSFGAHMSPTGQPTYFNTPAVTQENLIPPPARKKVKTGPGPQQHSQQVASPAVSQAGPSPQVKARSPELKRQAQAESTRQSARPSFVCPDTACDRHKAGFSSQQALDAHHQEEHVKPYENPEKFALNTLAEMLGLDDQGHSQPKAAGTGESSQVKAPRMAPGLSKQSQMSAVKAELASTPMSRTASAAMNRQGSATGRKEGDNKKSPAGAANSTPKPAPLTPDEDPWAHSLVDPQTLLTTFAPLAGGQLGIGGKDQFLTPNDTPEAVSNEVALATDFTETAHLNLDISWASPGDGDMDLDLEGFLELSGTDVNATLEDSMPYIVWEDPSPQDVTMPVDLNTTLYSLACS